MNDLRNLSNSIKLDKKNFVTDVELMRSRNRSSVGEAMKIIRTENWNPNNHETNRKMKLRQSIDSKQFFAIDRPMGTSSELTILNRKRGIPFS